MNELKVVEELIHVCLQSWGNQIKQIFLLQETGRSRNTLYVTHIVIVVKKKCTARG